MSDRDAHMTGLLRLVEPAEKPRFKRWSATPKGREKLLKAMLHGMVLDPRLCVEPPKGSRSKENLLKLMRQHGAPTRCYIISSDGYLDDTFQDLEQIIFNELGNFWHGTLLSSVPGKLAFYRTAGMNNRHLICYRPD